MEVATVAIMWSYRTEMTIFKLNALKWQLRKLRNKMIVYDFLLTFSNIVTIFRSSYIFTSILNEFKLYKDS